MIPRIVKWAPDVKFVENTVPTKPGDGLWKTATAIPTTFKIYVPDPVAQQIGFLGVMEENGRPIELALRLKFVDGQITEAEHLIARNLRRGRPAESRTSCVRLFAAKVPPDRRVPARSDAENRRLLLRSAGHRQRRRRAIRRRLRPPRKRHADHQQSAASDCRGRGTVIGRTRLRRSAPYRTLSTTSSASSPAASGSPIPRPAWFSASRSSAIPWRKHVLKIVGVPGVPTTDLGNFKPFDLPAAHIFKISGGKMHEIEAMGFTMPYNSKTGWE